MSFLSLCKAKLRIFFKFDTSILPLAIESRHGSMTRNDSSARMRPVIAMWYKIRTANRDEENSPDERCAVWLIDRTSSRCTVDVFLERLFMQMMHRCDRKSIFTIKSNLLWIKKCIIYNKKIHSTKTFYICVKIDQVLCIKLVFNIS